ncbi:DUF2490 domain-containing protein [Sphingomonas sp. RS2018]
MRHLLILAAVLASTPAAAQADHDTQVWNAATVTTTLSPTLDATMEVHIRSDDRFPELGQLLLRPSLTYRLPRGWSATAGYLYFRNDPTAAPATQEHRLWQQFGYRFTKADVTTRVTGRTRLEQRFRVGASDDIAWRVRQQLRLETPLTTRGSLKAVVWNETFIALDDTRWGVRRGFDQTRSFVGVGLPIGRGMTLEPGYLNQVVNRRAPARVNHIAALNLFARL